LLVHTPLWQSLPAEHVLPAAHLPQEAPPQSMSVSVPFLTVSPHVGTWHFFGLPEQTPLWQSPPTLHVLPFAHELHPPPQSMSVSVPFLTVSLHAGA
jgi:hypothetical protein